MPRTDRGHPGTASRHDQNYWQSVEGYVVEHTDARFSHGICPECKEKLTIRRGANG